MICIWSGPAKRKGTEHPTWELDQEEAFLVQAHPHGARTASVLRVQCGLLPFVLTAAITADWCDRASNARTVVLVVTVSAETNRKVNSISNLYLHGQDEGKR